MRITEVLLRTSFAVMCLALTVSKIYLETTPRLLKGPNYYRHLERPALTITPHVVMESANV